VCVLDVLRIRVGPGERPDEEVEGLVPRRKGRVVAVDAAAGEAEGEDAAPAAPERQRPPRVRHRQTLMTTVTGHRAVLCVLSPASTQKAEISQR
jgi:hypothetical protein